MKTMVMIPFLALFSFSAFADCDRASVLKQVKSAIKNEQLKLALKDQSDVEVNAKANLKSGYNPSAQKAYASFEAKIPVDQYNPAISFAFVADVDANTCKLKNETFMPLE